MREGVKQDVPQTGIVRLWVLDELNYDKFYADSDRIHAVLVND